jgi:hypothetical protein
MIAARRKLRFKLGGMGNVDNFLQLLMLHHTDYHFIQHSQLDIKVPIKYFFPLFTFCDLGA